MISCAIQQSRFSSKSRSLLHGPIERIFMVLPEREERIDRITDILSTVRATADFVGGAPPSALRHGASIHLASHRTTRSNARTAPRSFVHLLRRTHAAKRVKTQRTSGYKAYRGRVSFWPSTGRITCAVLRYLLPAQWLDWRSVP